MAPMLVVLPDGGWDEVCRGWEAVLYGGKESGLEAVAFCTSD